MAQTKSAERRRFFRINDTIGVAYRKLTGADQDLRADTGLGPATAASLLRVYDETLKEQFAQLAKRDPALEQLLQTLNKKINCVANQLELENQLLGRVAHRVQEVNISACGMAFVVDEDLIEGNTLGIDIALYPSEQHLFTYGTVVGVERMQHKSGTYVRVEFYGMNGQDQELLIQHVVQRQSRLLRAARDSRA